MNLFHNEKFLRIALLSFGLAAICASMLHLIARLRIPGLEPLLSAVFWGLFWQWNRIRGKHPGGMYSFFYLLIISMNLYSSISQIWLTIT